MMDPYKMAEQVIVLHILIFVFLDCKLEAREPLGDVKCIVSKNVHYKYFITSSIIVDTQKHLMRYTVNKSVLLFL